MKPHHSLMNVLMTPMSSSSVITFISCSGMRQLVCRDGFTSALTISKSSSTALPDLLQVKHPALVVWKCCAVGSCSLPMAQSVGFFLSASQYSSFALSYPAPAMRSCR